jgi:hypothetical protein
MAKCPKIRDSLAQAIIRSSNWWAVLGSNRWPLPCETEVGCLQINDMRAVHPIATRTCCHLISLDISNVTIALSQNCPSVVG